MQNAHRNYCLCALESNISFTACTTAVQVEVKHKLLLKDCVTAGPKFYALTIFCWLCTTVLSDKGDLLVLVNFNSHEYPWFWPFSFPAMKLHYDIKLRVVDTPQGKKFATQVRLDG